MSQTCRYSKSTSAIARRSSRHGRRFYQFFLSPSLGLVDEIIPHRAQDSLLPRLRPWPAIAVLSCCFCCQGTETYLLGNMHAHRQELILLTVL